MSQQFQFSKIPGIENSVFDNSISTFFDHGIEGTIKEDIQNALDAKIPESSLPVSLKITLDTLLKEDIPGINEVFQHIQSLQGANSYTNEKINYMRSKEKMVVVPVLTIEDSNTIGLSGALNGQSENKGDTYGVYAYNKGVHAIDANSEYERSRGGSHGIGKISNNAVSDINLMYFANCDEFGNQHLGGTVQLIEHNLDEQCYRSMGYFANLQQIGTKTKFMPFQNVNYQFLFAKRTRGLKIIIPYLRDEFNDDRRIICAICDNFFLAILNNKLNVSFLSKGKECLINQETLRSIVENPYYYTTDVKQMKKNFTPLYVQTYLDQSPLDFIVKNNTDEYNFKLYFTYDEEIPTGRLGIIRTIGMKIEDFKVRNNIRKPFNAVMVGGIKEDQYLKSLENESHSQISSNGIRDNEELRTAKSFLRNLKTGMSKIIAEYIDANNPTEGFVNTDDLIYETENSFNSDLSTISEKVELSNKRSLRKRNEKETWSSPNNHAIRETDSAPYVIKKRKPRKTKISDEETTEASTIILSPEVVNRVVTNGTERIKFNFNSYSGSENWKSCTLFFKVVDGLGVEHGNEFNLKKNYFEIVDAATGKIYDFDSQSIKNIDISDGIALLNLRCTDKYNRKLKFKYIVEVAN